MPAASHLQLHDLDADRSHGELARSAFTGDRSALTRGRAGTLPAATRPSVDLACVAQKLQCSHDDAALHPLHPVIAGPAAPARTCHDGCQRRRAALAYGPDIWEVIKFLREVDERGPVALTAAAEVFAVDTSRISTATSYYGDYADEIDAEIADADEASARAEAAWRVQQQLIA